MCKLTLDTLKQLPIFNHVHQTTLEDILSCGVLQHYEAGRPIFYDKDNLLCTYILVSGTSMLYKTHSTGQNKVIFVLNDGALLNEVIDSSLPASINCKAYDDCDILTIYNDDLLRLMENDFNLTRNILNALSVRVRRLYRQLKNASSVIKIEKKLAAKLWKLSKDYGIPCEKGVMINIPITITSLAELLGSYRETISRALKILISHGLVLYEHKHIIVPDPDKLSQYFKSP